MIKHFCLLIYLFPLLIIAQNQRGKVEIYSKENNDRILASGDSFTNNMTWMAHETLPVNSTVRLSNPKNGESINLKVKDRGPFLVGYVAQVPQAVAEHLDLISGDLVKLELVQIARSNKELDYEKLLLSLTTNNTQQEDVYVNVLDESNKDAKSLTWQLASFSNKENATNYLEKHQKDFKSKLYILLFNNSLFKVCAGKFKTRKEAEEAKTNFKSEYQSAFILDLP